VGEKEGGEGMSEQEQRILEEEIIIKFDIQLYKVIIERKIGANTEYEKFRVNIETLTGEINHEETLPAFTVDNVLRQIKRLYDIFKYYDGNPKLREGVREEILKLISYLIWVLY